MTKEAAIYKFWSSFNIAAYEENAVPTGREAPEFPYITYSLATDSFGGEVAMPASIWYKSTSWVQCNAKTREISVAIGMGGTILPCDDGAIWLKRGQPFAQSMGDPNNDMVRRKYLNVIAEFITQN